MGNYGEEVNATAKRKGEQDDFVKAKIEAMAVEAADAVGANVQE